MATGLFDYFSEESPKAWFDPEELQEVWFDKDLIVADAVVETLLAELRVVLQAVNRAGTF